MSPVALVFYVLFGVILFIMYLGIRRRWLPPTPLAILGVVGSIITMTLMALAQGNNNVQAIFVGLLVGGLFSAGTLAMAWYFHSNTKR